MNTVPYTLPQFFEEAFNCPNCHAYAKQHWKELWGTPQTRQGFARVANWYASLCDRCGEPSVWFAKTLVYPDTATAPHPNADLPTELHSDYEEARAIASRSSRGAAALLRLILQKLCVHLGEKGENLNDDIASLVKKGLHSRVQKALDSVRVIGNEAVHPGTIDLRDTPELAASLFALVNFIAEKMLTESKEIDAIYSSRPKAKVEAIKKRDGVP